MWRTTIERNDGDLMSGEVMKFDDGIVDDIASAIVDALNDGAQAIAQESRNQVPVATGALKKDCKVEVDGKDVTVQYDLPYAILVHEDMDMHRKQGKAKFLEEPFYAKVDDVVNAVKDEIMKVIK